MNTLEQAIDIKQEIMHSPLWERLELFNAAVVKSSGVYILVLYGRPNTYWELGHRVLKAKYPNAMIELRESLRSSPF